MFINSYIYLAVYDFTTIFFNIVQVIPPAEWSSKSQQISDDYVLSSITIQKPSKLKHGGFDIGFDKLETMTYANYVKECKEMEAKLCGGQKLTVEQIEDLHWSKLCKVKKKYAINNDKSLFGEDVSIWNLDKFTSKESTIHSNQTHHRCDVSKFFKYHSIYNMVHFSQNITFVRIICQAYYLRIATSVQSSARLASTLRTET